MSTLPSILALVVCTPFARAGDEAPLVVDDGEDVRPILAESCFPCHGPDANKLRAGLRLDRRLPDIQRSLILPRITAEDPEERMPLGSSLSDAEIGVLRRWIEQGATWSEHWSLVPPVRPPIPTVLDRDWPTHPLDHFVLAALESGGLPPSPEAERRTWIRRVSFDLVGLPPTVEEIDSFLRDHSPEAFASVVDRLLASPHHGERMAQGWLDLARCADTTGFAADQPRTIWPYRDWVIEALNRNQPFDRFTLEQLAGDLLPEATDEQRLATGFLRMAMQARGNNPRKEEFRVRGIVDRLDTISRTWLGLTLSCAECHDHKYDPISQREYYSLFAIFNNVPHHGEGYGVHGPRMNYLPEKARDRRDALDQEIAGLEAEERHPSLDLEDELELLRGLAPLDALSWIGEEPAVSDASAPVGRWIGAAAEGSKDAPPGALGSRQFSGIEALQFDGSAGSPLPDGFTLGAWIRTDQPIGDLLSKYDWQAGQRSFVFGIGGEGDAKGAPGALYAWVSATADPFEGVEVYGSIRVDDDRWHHVAFSFEPGHRMSLFVDGVRDEAARVLGSVPGRLARSDRPLVVGAGFSRSTTPNPVHFTGHLSDVQLVRGALHEVRSLVMPSNLRALLGREDASSDPLLQRFLRWLRPAASARRVRLEELRRERLALLEQAVEAPVMAELTTPRETCVHQRGDFRNRGDRVSPGLPAALHPLTTEQKPDRLGFARWLVQRDNPLTARVVVNRAWQHYFGVGLVRTSDDFGMRGEGPSHPGLLDWLAVEFMDSGWDQKALHRLITTSSTYRQSSRTTPERRALDPSNRRLARGPRHRLDAEQIRDAVLSVSGLLDPRIGGKSVFPVQIEGYWEEKGQTKDSGTWATSEGRDRYRRALYTYWKRMALYPSLSIFDAPSRERCTVSRSRTNTPMQALVTLNDPVFVEAARAFAERILIEAGPEPSARVDHAFELALARAPEADERAEYLEFIRAMEHSFRAAPGDAEALIAVGRAPRRTSVPAVELAAWTMFASTLFNLDETVTRQ